MTLVVSFASNGRAAVGPNLEGEETGVRESRGVSAGRQIAVLPIENRAGVPAPLADLEATLTAKLEQRGFLVLGDPELKRFMRRNRVRHTGGVSGVTARQLREETGARAAFVTSLDLFRESGPPKAALTARLVSTSAEPRILWMHTAAATGDESPGFLDLGLVADVDTIVDRVTTRIVDSLELRTREPASGHRKSASRSRNRFRSEVSYGSTETPVLRAGTERMIVLPLVNSTLR